MNQNNDLVILLAMLVGGFLVILLLVGLLIKLDNFFRELSYINLEINRTTGNEQKHWKRKKRRLWRMLLPFYKK